MGAPDTGMKAASDQAAAESLLTAFKTLSASERRRHASVLNYWLSVRGDKEFPPLHDLDPLELSDAGPSSILMELISGGHDAEIRHLGEALRDEAWPERIIDAPNPSILACIAKKLPIVAISRDFLAFEDEYDGADGKTRCSVTLLPLSAGGAWVDYVYALVSVDSARAKGAKVKAEPEADAQPQATLQVEQPAEEYALAPEPLPETPVAEDVAPETPAEEAFVEEYALAPEPLVAEAPAAEQPFAEAEAEPFTETAEVFDEEYYVEPEAPPAKATPGFSKLLDSIAGLTGFYGSQPVKVEPVLPSDDFAAEEDFYEQPAGEDEPAEFAKQPEPVMAEQPEPEPVEQFQTASSEGSLQNKLTEVRAKADEARMARLRATSALHEGLGAAYDFALDAEDAPEEYLRLVEAQGLKIQLRSPMKPVVKLAFAGMCDEGTIKQLEAVLSWAFDQELPRGTLADQIEAAGGIGPIVNGLAKAA